MSTIRAVALLREELGRRIAQARHDARMTQQELAAAIGLRHAQDISRYERGLVDVPGHRIDLIASVTGKPRSYFTRGSDEPDLSGETWAEDLAEVREKLGHLAQLQEAVDRIEALLRAIAGDPPSERGGASGPRQLSTAH